MRNVWRLVLSLLGLSWRVEHTSMTGSDYSGVVRHDADHLIWHTERQRLMSVDKEKIRSHILMQSITSSNTI